MDGGRPIETVNCSLYPLTCEASKWKNKWQQKDDIIKSGAHSILQTLTGEVKTTSWNPQLSFLFMNELCMTELSHWALLYCEINNGNMSWSGFTFSSCFFFPWTLCFYFYFLLVMILIFFLFKIGHHVAQAGPKLAM